MHFRAFVAAAALALASLFALTTIAMADDFSAGSFAHPMGVLDIASCDDLAYCGVAITPAIPIDVASIDAADRPGMTPSGLMRGNCSDGPAWVAVVQSDGSFEVERLPACNARRYDPGWRYI